MHINSLFGVNLSRQYLAINVHHVIVVRAYDVYGKYFLTSCRKIIITVLMKQFGFLYILHLAQLLKVDGNRYEPIVLC